MANTQSRPEDINRLNVKISDLLRHDKLLEAANMLRGKAADLLYASLVDETDEVLQTYKYMIHYMLEGADDPSRLKMYASLKRRIADIAARLTREQEAKENPKLYFSTLRTTRLRHTDLAALIADYRKNIAPAQLSAEMGQYDKGLFAASQRILDDIFCDVWVRYPLTKRDAAILKDVLTSPADTFELKCQIISALLLAGIQYFDPRGVEVLADAWMSDNADERIEARILTAIVLILSENPGKVNDDDDLGLRLRAMADSPNFPKHLRTVLMAITATRRNPIIADKLRTMMEPLMKNMTPDIIKRIRSGMEGDGDMLDPEANPEWEDMLRRNGVLDKMQELTDIQMEGGDVMMPAFSNLKDFPFFNSLSHWFLPFSLNYPDLDVARSMADTPIGDLLCSDEMMCDSDRYSFALSLERMPEAQRNFIHSQMSEQFAQMKEEMQSQLTTSRPVFDGEVTRYVRDLYRFFNLFNRHVEFQNPFAGRFELTEMPVIGKEVDSETLTVIGEFYFKIGLYADALAILQKSEDADSDVSLLEKIGYCHQQLRNLEAAVVCYGKAELFEPDSKWLIKKLAACHRLLGHYDEALSYYRRALESDPENISLLMNAGLCCMEISDLSGALNHFYKVSWLQPDNEKAVRAIAWCELLKGDYAKSRSLYERILTTAPTAGDYLNMGHLALLEGRLREALAMYRQSVLARSGGFPEFEMEFEADAKFLIERQVDPHLLPMLLDAMRL